MARRQSKDLMVISIVYKELPQSVTPAFIVRELDGVMTPKDIYRTIGNLFRRYLLKRTKSGTKNYYTLPKYRIEKTKIILEEAELI